MTLFTNPDEDETSLQSVIISLIITETHYLLGKCHHNLNPSSLQMSEKAEESICEQTMADLLYLTENEGKLRLDNFNL